MQFGYVKGELLRAEKNICNSPCRGITKCVLDAIEYATNQNVIFNFMSVAINRLTYLLLNINFKQKKSSFCF